VSIVLLIERRLPWFLHRRSGQPGSNIGFKSDEYYLIVEEQTKWGENAAKNRLKFLFKNAIKKIIVSNRFKSKPKPAPQLPPPEHDHEHEKDRRAAMGKVRPQHIFPSMDLEPVVLFFSLDQIRSSGCDYRRSRRSCWRDELPQVRG